MTDLALIRKVGRIKDDSFQKDFIESFQLENMAVSATFIKRYAQSLDKMSADIRSLLEQTQRAHQQYLALLQEKDGILREIDSINKTIGIHSSDAGSKHKNVIEMLQSLKENIDTRFSSVYGKSDIDLSVGDLKKLVEAKDLISSKKIDKLIKEVESRYSKAEADSAAEKSRARTKKIVSSLTALKDAYKDYDKKLKLLEKGITEMGYSLQLFTNGTLVGTTPALNLAAGTNVTLSAAFVNGIPKVTINSTGGSGVTIETPTGSVDGSNTQFTPTSKPTYVVADGATYFENAGYTWDGTHINMTVAPSQYIRDAI